MEIFIFKSIIEGDNTNKFMYKNTHTFMNIDCGHCLFITIV